MGGSVRPRRWASLLVCVSIATCVTTADAQITPPVRELDAEFRTPLTDSAVIARDASAGLSWVIPADRDLAHYTTPAMCGALVGLISHETVGWTGWDTVRTGSRADTLSAIASAVGRRCAASFTAGNVESRQLRALVALSLALNNVPLATAAVDRRAREAETPGDRGSALLEGVQTFNAARPKRTAAAESLLTRFAVLEATQPWWKVLARHDVLANTGIDGVDTTTMRRLDRENVVAYRALSPKGRTFVGEIAGGGVFLVGAVDELARVPVRDRCDRQANAFLAWPQAALPDSMMWSEAASHDREKTVQEWAAQPQLPLGVMDEPYDPRMLTWAARVRSNCLKDTLREGNVTFPTLPGHTWFAPGSMTPGPRPALPVANHATLFAFVALGNGRMSNEVAEYRRLYDTYRKDGLDVILVAQPTVDRVWGSRALTPDEVAKVHAWYFHDYLHLPMPLLVVQSEPWKPVLSSLYDRHGKPVGHDGNLPLWEAFIRQALGLPVAPVTP